MLVYRHFCIISGSEYDEVIEVKLMTETSGFSSFNSLRVPVGREANLQNVWLKSRLFFLRMTHPVDDVVALMEEFETGIALRHNK